MKITTMKFLTFKILTASNLKSDRYYTSFPAFFPDPSGPFRIR